LISIVALSLIILLVISELIIYLQAPTKPELYVDTSMGEKFQINGYCISSFTLWLFECERIG